MEGVATKAAKGRGSNTLADALAKQGVFRTEKFVTWL